MRMKGWCPSRQYARRMESLATGWRWYWSHRTRPRPKLHPKQCWVGGFRPWRPGVLPASPVWLLRPIWRSSFVSRNPVAFVGHAESAVYARSCLFATPVPTFRVRVRGGRLIYTRNLTSPSSFRIAVSAKSTNRCSDWTNCRLLSSGAKLE